MKAKIQMGKAKLKQMLSWSDRLGMDEIDEVGEILNLLSTKEVYDKKEMEKAFIAGGKLARDIKNDSFDEFLKKL